MSSTVEAVYENGVFRPLERVNLPEHQRVTVHVPDVEAIARSDGDPFNTLKTDAKRAAADTPEPWTEEKNSRRCDLIDKQIEGSITDAGKAELENLQSQAIAYRDRIARLPFGGARKLHQELLAKKRAAQG